MNNSASERKGTTHLYLLQSYIVKREWQLEEVHFRGGRRLVREEQVLFPVGNAMSEHSL